ncbi:MAG: SprB repeat-containing protein, partial [Bacteroidota bacterium]
TAGGVLPYSFNWNNGSNSTILQNIGAGTYTVTITDNQNCTASQSYSVQQPPQLLLQQTSALHVSCYGSSDGALSAAAAGGTPPYSIGWNTGVQSTGLDNLPAGTYTATATDANACTATISINLEQPPLFVLTLTSSDPVCTTADGSVTAAVTGGVPPYSYLWATGELTNEIESLEAGVYAITVTDDKNRDRLAALRRWRLPATEPMDAPVRLHRVGIWGSVGIVVEAVQGEGTAGPEEGE